MISLLSRFEGVQYLRHGTHRGLPLLEAMLLLNKPLKLILLSSRVLSSRSSSFRVVSSTHSGLYAQAVVAWPLPFAYQRR